MIDISQYLLYVLTYDNHIKNDMACDKNLQIVIIIIKFINKLGCNIK